MLVTGAGSGIGMATARCLSGLGFTTIGLVPSEAEREALLSAAREWGTPVSAIVADLSVAGAADIASELQLYALVNNVGYMNVGLVEDVGLDEARRQFEAMVFAPMGLILRTLPAMLERGEGKVVNVTSAAAHAPVPFAGWYLAAKSALRQLTDSLRIELSATGIDVVDLQPGAIDTPIWARATDELARHRAVSSRPGVYARAFAATSLFRAKATAPEQVAAAIGHVLTTARPPAHVRVGRGATVLRLVSEVLPDGLSGRMRVPLAGGH